MADSVERTPAAVLDGEAGKGRPRGQQVVEILRSAIIMGSYEPGERLIEATLSTELGTSRGPVREALRQLENEGLVMSFPYRGAVVLGVSDDEVQEVLIPIRLTLERYSFLRALERMTDEDFAELGKQIWLMEQAADADDLPRIVEADLRFHEIVIAASGQTHTVQIWRTIWPRIRAYFYRYGRGQDLDRMVDEHRDLLATLQSRDPDRMLALLEQHIAVPSPPAAPAGSNGRKAARRTTRAGPPPRRALHERAADGQEPAHRLPHPRRRDPRRRRRRLLDREGRRARRRRRVGQRQVGHRALDHAADRPAGPDRAGLVDHVRGPRPRARSPRTRWRRSGATRSR